MSVTKKPKIIGYTCKQCNYLFRVPLKSESCTCGQSFVDAPKHGAYCRLVGAMEQVRKKRKTKTKGKKP